MPANGPTTYDLGPSPEHYKPYFSSEARHVSTGVVGDSAGHIRGFLNAIPNESVRSLTERAMRRMDQVASVELSTWGRARGALQAMSAMPMRLDVTPIGTGRPRR